MKNLSGLTKEEQKLEKIVEKIKFSPTIQGIAILKDFLNESITRFKNRSRFIAWGDNKRKIYSSASDPVKISLDGKCINTITGQELKLYQVEDHKLEENIQKLKNERSRGNIKYLHQYFW